MLLTNKARKVMFYSGQEARRLNHQYIDTEHVLLGLIKESDCVASKVLKNLTLDAGKVRLEVEKMMQSSTDVQTKGQPVLTPRAKKVIEFSLHEARALGYHDIGTEDILLGLLRENEGVAARVLMDLSIKIEVVFAEVFRVLRADALIGPWWKHAISRTLKRREHATPPTWPLSESAGEVHTMALNEALRLGQCRIGSEHLFLALLKRPADPITLALQELTVEPKALYDKIRVKLSAGKPPPAQEPKTGEGE